MTQTEIAIELTRALSAAKLWLTQHSYAHWHELAAKNLNGCIELLRQPIDETHLRRLRDANLQPVEIGGSVDHSFVDIAYSQARNVLGSFRRCLDIHASDSFEAYCRPEFDTAEFVARLGEYSAMKREAGDSETPDEYTIFEMYWRKGLQTLNEIDEQRQLVLLDKERERAGLTSSYLGIQFQDVTRLVCDYGEADFGGKIESLKLVEALSKAGESGCSIESLEKRFDAVADTLYKRKAGADAVIRQAGLKIKTGKGIWVLVVKNWSKNSKDLEL